MFALSYGDGPTEIISHPWTYFLDSLMPLCHQPRIQLHQNLFHQNQKTLQNVSLLQRVLTSNLQHVTAAKFVIHVSLVGAELLLKFHSLRL